MVASAGVLVVQNTTLFVFSNDLRLGDNQALLEAASHCRHLLCLYCVDPAWFRPGRYTIKPMGAHRWSFLRETLYQLEQELAQCQQKLLVRFQSPQKAIEQLIQAHQISTVYRSENIGFWENQSWDTLKSRFPEVTFKGLATFTLFHQDELPFPLAELPPTFTQFRKQVEQLTIAKPKPRPDILPSPMPGLNYSPDQLPETVATPHHCEDNRFAGGEQAALNHLNQYFASAAPATYKKTRNALQGRAKSTRFSPWLAHGALSARQIVEALKQYEEEQVANESTYWIFFELLWREYFQWYAAKYGSKLFHFHGIHPPKRGACYYPERFQKWCAGNTPWPIVNACMKELQVTGYLSNRGRQLVASCLVNELAMDWRYGAAWFEYQLIDYDVASNWGNWQYQAGVGADPRGPRRFNLEKQTQQYDPDGTYIKQWHGEPTFPLDSVDIADWPILPDQQQ